MATSLVRRAKLLRPQLAPDLLSRPRLIERLTAGLDRPLTLLSTPAGYGKTTVLGQWLTAAALPSAWLTLDERDGPLPDFVAAVVGALQTLRPDVGRETIGLLQLPTMPPPDYLGGILADELLDQPGPVLLVLDDYHTIADPAAHTFLTALLDYPPPSLHLVLATRVDPPLPLARLRARDRLTELRGHDLAFTSEETRVFLDQAAGKSVDQAAMTLLEERNEGWAVGLRLAALALRSGSDTTQVARGFARRRQRQALDFMLDEVLDHQPADVQAFLLRTSVVERVCGSLAEALTEEPTADHGGGTGLRHLTEANLFVVALAESEDGLDWVRYHPLFRDLLRERLERSAGTEAVVALHRRAADWFANHGLIDEAIQSLVMAGAPEAAARLVEERVATTLDREDWITLWRWLRRLPASLERRRPGLMLAHAAVDQFRGRVGSMIQRHGAIIALLAEDDPTLTATEASHLHAQADTILALFRVYGGDSVGAAEAARRALPHLPDPHSYLGGSARLMLSLALHQLGPDAGAQHEPGDRPGVDDEARAPREMFALSMTNFLSGSLPAARHWATLMLDVSTRRGLHALVGWAHYVLGRIAYETDALAEAQVHFGSAAAGRHQHNLVTVIESHLGLALAEQAANQPGDAERQLNDLDEVLAATGNDEARPLVHACQADLALRRGDIAAAVQWLESGLPGPGEVLLFMEFPSLTRARARLARGAPGDVDAAIALLTALQGRAAREHVVGGTIRALAGLALAEWARDDSNTALDYAERALFLAEPGGFVRPFLDLGQPMATILKALSDRQPPSSHLVRLLARFDAEPGPIMAPVWPGTSRPERYTLRPTSSIGSHLDSRLQSAPLNPALALVELLTAREMQVLGCLTRHLTNKEIAAELSISPLTARHHVRNVCGKLGVSGRRQAVAIAAAMGLLSDRLM